MNRYAITIKEDRTATFYVDGSTMEKAKDELLENYGDYISNGMDDISLEVKDIEERRKKLTKFNHEKEEKSYG